MMQSQGRTAAVIVSATHSGAGKTTASTSIIRALRDGGLRVQSFKLGPDFIDTAYLAEAAGRPAVNLDLWMMGADGVKSSFARWSAGADIAVIEGMGALYDGEDGGERGSAAEVAKLLGVPVVLVLDVWGMTRTAGAVILGMREFDSGVRIGGCIFNRIGSETHRQMVETDLPDELEELVIGAIPREDSLLIPERHLGLLTTAENQIEAKKRAAAQRRAADGLDLGRLTRVAALEAQWNEGQPRSEAATLPTSRARLAIARDGAFCFYYEDNLSLLAEAGFELVPFQPTYDPGLPDGVDAVYLGGGYPESFAAELAANTKLSAELRGRAAEGMPIYAECGGLLYLGQTLTSFDGERHRMSGVLPLEAIMDPAYLSISYVKARTRINSPLGEAGTVARGQEFHQSRLVEMDPPNLYRLTTSNGEVRPGGHLRENVAASYVHLHFGSCPQLAPNLVAAAVAARKRFSPA